MALIHHSGLGEAVLDTVIQTSCWETWYNIVTKYSDGLFIDFIFRRLNLKP